MRQPRYFLPGDLAQYDYSTIFYDVFFNPSHTVLYMVGPPLLNLRKELFPAHATINGIRHRIRITEYLNKRVTVGAVRIKKKTPLTPSASVVLSFNTRFEHGFTLDMNRNTPGRTVLTAIQKDNRIEWIQDWVAHYQSRFGITDIYIYDNGSSNRAELRQLEEHISSVHIIEWDFPYGIYRSNRNKFAQIGMLNHCRLKYCQRSLMYNFDIDELLVYSQKDIEKRMKKGKIIKFGHFDVLSERNLPDTYSFSDFSRLKLPGEIGSREKYICRSDRVICNSVHSALHAPFRLVTLWDIFLHIISSRILLAVNLFGRMLPMQVVPLRDGYFLHYKAISTDWKNFKRLEYVDAEEVRYIAQDT
jgi:hypothetical protein